jgi:O-antigen ligase
MATKHDTAPLAIPVQPLPVLFRATPRNDLAVYLAVFLGYLMLLPPQMSVDLVGSVIPPYRFFLLGSLLFIMASALRGRLRFTWPDIFVFFATAWISLAMSITSEPDEAFTGSVAHIADVGCAYFFARAAIRDLRDLRMFLLLMLPGLFAVGVVMVVEAVTARHIVQGIASQITGREIAYASSPRFGLMRAQGPFAHPILAGIFLASFLPLYWLAGFKWWVKLAGAFAAFFSVVTVSSAALLALAAATILLAYNWLTERFVNLTWRLFFVFTGLGFFALEFGTNGGAFSFLVRFASLNAVSSYTRILIWEYGTQNVADSPWFGIGYREWERPSWLGFSIDNYWLLVAMRFGIPTVMLIALATLIAIFVLSRRSVQSRAFDRQAERGVVIALAVFALSLVSVSVWLSTQVWFFMLLGIAVSLANAGGPALPPPDRAPRPAKGGGSAAAE